MYFEPEAGRGLTFEFFKQKIHKSEIRHGMVVISPTRLAGDDFEQRIVKTFV